MEFMYPVFTGMPDGVTVGESGLSVVVSLVCSALLTPFVDFYKVLQVT